MTLPEDQAIVYVVKYLIKYLCLICDLKHYHYHKCQILVRKGKGSAKLDHPHSLFAITSDADKLDKLRLVLMYCRLMKFRRRP